MVLPTGRAVLGPERPDGMDRSALSGGCGRADSEGGTTGEE